MNFIAKTYLFFFLFILSFGLLGQNVKKINDLKYKVQIEPNVNKKADQLIELSTELMDSDYEEAIKYAYEGLNVSKGIHYTKGKLRAYFQIAETEYIAEQYDKAINALDLAFDLANSYGDMKSIARVNRLKGKVFIKRKDFEASRIYIQYSLDIGKKLKSKSIVALANACFGDLSSAQNKDYLALQYYVIAKDEIISTNEHQYKGNILFKMAKLQSRLNENKDAIENYLQSLKSYENIEDKLSQAKVSYELGVNYAKTGNGDQSVVFMKNSLGLAQEVGNEELIKKGYQAIADTYEKNNDYEKAFEYLKYYSAIKDTKEISELESQLELEKKNKEIELITKEKDFQKDQLENEKFYRRVGFIVLAIIVGLALFLLISLRQRDRINKQLLVATKRANQSKQDKEDFFAYTSHEIRTPLNAVVGMAKLLGETNLSESQQKYLRTINSSAQNILFLVNDVLDISKIEKGGLEFEKIEFSLHEIVEQIIESLSFKKFEKRVDLINKIDSKVPQVLIGDPVRFNQILLNLADNALKFTKEGSVTIGIDLLDKYEEKVRLKFSVQDTGIGIHEDKMKTIFQSYQQEHTSTTRQYGGTGLGLSICKLLIENMDGEIRINSEVNVGTTFHFDLWLPVSKLSSIDALRDKRINEVEHLQNMNILVADDNQLNREIFVDLVEDKKNNVTLSLAKNGQVCLDMLKENSFDLILMDIQMPIMDGYEASENIRKGIAGNENMTIPIIAMTAHVLEGVAEKCKESGMNDSISKPVNVNILHQKIKEHVSKDDIFTLVSKEIASEGSSIDNTESKIDLENLKSITRGKREKIKKYISMFLKNIPKDVELLNEQNESQNFIELKKTAHKIKGNLGYMGVSCIKEEVLFLEGLDIENINATKINQKIAVVNREIILILRELENFNLETL